MDLSLNQSSCLLSSPPCYNLPGHQLASAQEKLFNQNFFDVFIKGWKGGGERFYDLVHFTRVASPKDQKYFLAFRDLVLTLINLVKRFFWTQISSISISSSTFSIIMSLCFFVLLLYGTPDDRDRWKTSEQLQKNRNKMWHKESKTIRHSKPTFFSPPKTSSTSRQQSRRFRRRRLRRRVEKSTTSILFV